MCIFHALVIHCILPPFAHTFATLVMLWSISCFFILACHVYLILCSILLCLMFWASFSHSSCAPHALFFLFIPSSLAFFSPWPLCLFVSKRGRVYSRVYTGEFCHFYMALVHFLVHICRGRDTFMHTSWTPLDQVSRAHVSEFCSTVPNSHVKSRVCFRVLSRNSQRGRL